MKLDHQVNKGKIVGLMLNLIQDNEEYLYIQNIHKAREDHYFLEFHPCNKYMELLKVEF